jgi:hypothetical protein
MNGATGITFENSNIGPCAGRGVYINGGSGNNIYDSYIHVEGASTRCCDSRDGVFINNSNSNTLQGNIVAYSETNVQMFNSLGTVVTGNFLLNPQGVFPRGEQIQNGSGSNNAVIKNNLLVSTPDSTLGPALGTSSTAPILMGQDSTSNRPSDNLSIYTSSGCDVENNFITGGEDATTPGSGGSQDAAGCGLIADASPTVGSNSETFKNNILVNTGECAIGIANGTNETVTGNKSFSLNPNTGGNTADYIWNQYAPPCGPVLLNGNISTLIRSTGYASGYWNGGGCGAVTCDGTNTNIDSCNTFDYGGGRTAYYALIADPAVTTPPLIPPQPKNCVANSPYSTQTSLPPCS